MNNIIARIIKEPKKYLAKLVLKFSCCLSDEQYMKASYMCMFGYPLDLKNPRTFCEKLQWLKLYDRRPEYTKMVDKYEVKRYVADKIGGNYIIPTLGIWDSPEDINWNTLPRQFVLKTTHGGGGNGVIICKDKTKFDTEVVCKQLHIALNSDLYKSFREWPYKNVQKRIIAEKFITPEDNSAHADLTDYKFYCFNGEPRYCQVIRDRHSRETIDFYNMDWQHLEFVGLVPVACNGVNPVARPEKLAEMIDICKKLAESIPFVRVDLYNVKGKIYFGELTFYPAAGLGVFVPDEWNEKMGDLIDLYT